MGSRVSGKWMTLIAAVLTAGSAAAAGIAPYLPKIVTPPPYQPTTQPAEQMQVKLDNGLILKPGDFSRERSLNGDWKISGLENSARPFAADADLDKGYAKTDFADDKWDRIAVPLDWYRKYPNIRKADKGGKTCSKPYVKGWYRQQIELTADELKDKNVILHFDVAAYDAKLFVNGQEAGTHHGDFTPWDVNITNFLKPGRNTIALRLFSDFGPNFSAAAETQWTAAGTQASKSEFKATHVYGSQWSIDNIKGGLWQNVSLRFESPLYFTRILVDPVLKDSAVKVQYVINNPTGKAMELKLGAAVVSALKKTGPVKVGDAELGTIKLVPGENSGVASVKLTNPELWSPANPYLYYLSLYLAEGKTVVASDTVRFGYRDFKVKGRDFYLNGQRIYLFGENLPSVRFGGYGRSTADEVAALAKEIQGFKSLGYNIIRNPHMPIIAEALTIADEVGLMLLDEWGWSFTHQIDEPAFEKNNRVEIAEWVYRDYNNPCVVIWCCGNEVVHKNSEAVKRQLDKQVDWIRELDKSGRPVSNFSGSGSWWSYGKAKMNTDLIDLHDYLGLSQGAWTTWDNVFERSYRETVATYAENGKFNIPYIIWECVGFSWGGMTDKNFKPDDIRKYNQYVEKETNWGRPNGIGFSGTIGLTAALDAGRGVDYGKAVYGRRILEQIRQNLDVQGFAPWFHGSSLKVAAIWNQPVFCGLRNPGSIILRNVFAGRDYTQSLFVVNSTNNDYTGLTAVITLVNADGSTTVLKEVALGSLKAWTKETRDVTFAIPARQAAELGQLRVTVKNGNTELSRNFYDLFIQSPAVLSEPVVTKVKVALVDTGSSKDVAAVAAILGELKVKFDLLPINAPLDAYGLIIVPPTGANAKIKAIGTDWLLGRARQGASLLVLEQCSGGITVSNGTNLIDSPNTFVDLVIPSHPAFKGLTQDNFDTWNNPDYGYVINTMMDPFTLNALAVRGPFLGRRQIGGAVAEGSFGKGRVFCSQLNAVSLWGKDSAASTYLRNVLTYLANNAAPFKLVQPLVSGNRLNFSVNPKNAVFIDLKPYANRGFADEVDDDGKGGWTDQGNNDFRMMPLGRQTLANVPFEIIDPAKNNDRSCLVLRGSQRQRFPVAIKGIAVNDKLARIYFLHTCAWSFGKEAARYRINYEDGGHAEYVAVEGRNIGDWWDCSNLPEAMVGLSRTNRFGKQVGAFVAAWENPRPDRKIASVDFIATGEAVPVLIAMTGEKGHAHPLVIEQADGSDGKWGTLAWRGGDKPSVATVPAADSPCGGKAIKITMPAPKGQGVPVVIKRFPKTLLADNDYQVLSFWIKSETGGAIDIVLPIDDWKARLSATVPLTDKMGKWTKVRLNLREDMGLKNVGKWTLRDLRGEFFIYNGMEGRGNRPAATFLIDGITLE